MLFNTPVIATSTGSTQVEILVVVEEQMENQSCHLKTLTSKGIALSQKSMLRCNIDLKKLQYSAKRHYSRLFQNNPLKNNEVITVEATFQ